MLQLRQNVLAKAPSTHDPKRTLAVCSPMSPAQESRSCRLVTFLVVRAVNGVDDAGGYIGCFGFAAEIGRMEARISGDAFDCLQSVRSGRICDCVVEALKYLSFSTVSFDFVYSPCVLVSRHWRMTKSN